MKASEFLNEVFDSNVIGQLRKSNDNQFSTEARIGDRTIYFNGVSNSPGIWEIGFSETSRNGGIVNTHHYGVTGSGQEFKVFTFVIDSIIMLVQKYTPKAILFTSDHEKNDFDRSKLYLRMLDRMLPSEYHVEFKKGITFDRFTIIHDK